MIVDVEPVSCPFPAFSLQAAQSPQQEAPISRDFFLERIASPVTAAMIRITIPVEMNSDISEVLSCLYGYLIIPSIRLQEHGIFRRIVIAPRPETSYNKDSTENTEPKHKRMSEHKGVSKMKEFLKKKDIEISLRRYGIDALGAMAQGLFCSLLIGTIINTLGTQLRLPFLTNTVAVIAGSEYTVGGLASAMSGPAMATAIGYALKCPPLVLFSMITVGFAANALGGAGGPLAVLFVAILSAECGKAVSKETKVDILVTPLVTIGIGVLLSWLIAPPLGKAAMWLGNLIMWATELQPCFMGILVSVLVGMALTLPISSAAICAALGLTGLAGGAAVAGCSAQMIGFAVISFKENKWGGLVSQGIGTSMLQMGNIVKNPRIWIAPTLASAITGPIATCLFKLRMDGAPVSSGMGTCGLVGQIGVYTGWVNDIAAGTKTAITGPDWAGLLLISFILPALLSLLIHKGVQKAGWVKEGDLKL